MLSAISTAAGFVAGEESFSPAAYWDVNGYAIGYGNHYYQDGSPVGQFDTIEHSDAVDLMTYYLQQQIDQLLPQLQVNLNSNQLAALASIRYNAGSITTTLLNLINSGAATDEVAAQIRVTEVTSGGQPSAVVQARRNREAELYATNPALPLIGVALAALVLFFLVR